MRGKHAGLFHAGEIDLRASAPVASKSPSRISPFRTSIPFLPRSDARVRSVDIPPCACLSLKKILSARNATTYFGRRRVMRYRLVEKRFVLPNGISTVLRSGIITLDFKRFDSIYGIHLEDRSKCKITHRIAKVNVFSLRSTSWNNLNQIPLSRTHFHI